MVAIGTAPQGGGDVVSMGFNDVPKATDYLAIGIPEAGSAAGTVDGSHQLPWGG